MQCYKSTQQYRIESNQIQTHLTTATSRTKTHSPTVVRTIIVRLSTEFEIDALRNYPKLLSITKLKEYNKIKRKKYRTIDQAIASNVQSN